MKTTNALILFALMGLWLAGCNKDSGTTASNSSSGIALVDPDRILQGMGWNLEMQKNLQAAGAEITRQIDAHLAPARATLEKKKAELFAAAKLTKEQIDNINTHPMTRTDLEKFGFSSSQIDELFQAGTTWQNESASARNAGQQAMGGQQAAVQNAYREVIYPVIREVAHEKGRVAVFQLTQAVYLDSSIDITDAVISNIQKKPSIKVTLPDMPKIEWRQTTQPSTAPATTAPSTEPALSPATQPHQPG